MTVTACHNFAIQPSFYESAISAAFAIERICLKAESVDSDLSLLLLAHACCRIAYVIKFELHMRFAKGEEPSPCVFLRS